jgi:hypothetical protein
MDKLEPIRRVFRNAGLYHHASDDLLCGELASAVQPQPQPQASAEDERLLEARIAEQDRVIAIARQNAELLTGYWKAAVAEAKALRAEMKAHGITPEGDDEGDE